MGLALAELRDMADALLRGARAGDAAAKAARSAAGADDKAADNDTNAAGAPEGKAAAIAAAAAAATAAATAAADAAGGAASLAATVPAHLREVGALLDASAKERFVGRAPCSGSLCFIPAAVSQADPWRGDVLATAHVASTLHRVLWLMLAPAPDAKGDAASIFDARLPRELGAEVRGLVSEMADAAVAALREFAAALPPSGGPKARSVGAGGHVERYVALCEQVYGLSLGMRRGDAPGAPADAAGGKAGKGGSAGGKGSGGGGGNSSTKQRWLGAFERVRAINAEKRGKRATSGRAAAAMSAVVTGALESGDVAAARWCSTLLLLQQLGVALWRLQDCMGECRERGWRGAGAGWGCRSLCVSCAAPPLNLYLTPCCGPPHVSLHISTTLRSALARALQTGAMLPRLPGARYVAEAAAPRGAESV